MRHVMQVAGELSNAGQPMRRFMQTFILAPQSPKKYYVHNDIFRYQDEVFHDIATDSEPDGAGEFICFAICMRQWSCFSTGRLLNSSIDEWIFYVAVLCHIISVFIMAI